MKGFVYALTQLDEAPDTVLLYNGGAKLSVEGAETVEDLKTLEEAGTEILTCGTCLNHYGLTEQLAVGSVRRSDPGGRGHLPPDRHPAAGPRGVGRWGDPPVGG